MRITEVVLGTWIPEQIMYRANEMIKMGVYPLEDAKEVFATAIENGELDAVKYYIRKNNLEKLGVTPERVMKVMAGEMAEELKKRKEAQEA